MIKKLAILALAALAGAACMKEPQGDQGAEGTGEPVNVNFCLSALPMTQIEVRSVDNQITDLWVVQCVDSTVVVATYFATVDPTNVEVELKNSPGRVYFVANPVADASLYTVGQHERDVVAASGTVAVAQTSPTPSLEVYPMAGKWEGTPKSGKISDEIKLYRSYAQINLSIGASLPAGHTVEINRVTLSVPKIVQYYRDPSTLESQGIYPPSQSGAVSLTLHNSSLELTAPGQITATAYCPEAYRGKGTATVQTDKDDVEHGPNGGKDLVYLNISGEYTINGARYNMTCRVYLGANNTDDYNLLRNNSYNVSVTFRGKNKADIRMEKIGSVYEIDGETSLTDYADNNENQWMLVRGKREDVYDGWNTIAPGFDFTTNKGTGPGADGSSCPAGWRLPSLAEMRVLYTYSIDVKGNDNLEYQNFWTSSWIGSDSAPKVLLLDSNEGRITEVDVYNYPVSSTLRCVRDLPFAVGLKYPYVSGTTIISRDESGGAMRRYLLQPAQNERLSSLADQPDYTASDTLDRVVPQLQVAKADCGTGSTTYDFAQAYDACKAYSEPDAPAGSWRLPTHRDLHLMFACHTSLASSSGFTPMKTDDLGYVSGAQTYDKAKYLFCGENAGGESDKTTARYVRCVRAATSTSYPYLDGLYLISKDSKGGLADSDLLTDEQKRWLLTNDPYTSPIDDQGPYNKVSAKLRFSKDPCDEANCGVAPNRAGTATANSKYSYDKAYAACQGYSEPDAPAGTWRLPTQAEYRQLIKVQSIQPYVFHKLIGTYVSCVRSTGDHAYVWMYSQPSATLIPTSNALPIVKTNGDLADTFGIRCVRDE